MLTALAFEDDADVTREWTPAIEKLLGCKIGFAYAKKVEYIRRLTIANPERYCVFLGYPDLQEYAEFDRMFGPAMKQGLQIVVLAGLNGGPLEPAKVISFARTELVFPEQTLH